MKKQITFICIALLLVLTGCSTTAREMNTLDTSEPVANHHGYYSDDIVEIEVSAIDRHGYSVLMRNKSDSVLILNLDESSFVTEYGISVRIVDGRTKNKDTMLSQPVTAIPAGSTVVKEVYGLDYDFVLQGENPIFVFSITDTEDNEKLYVTVPVGLKADYTYEVLGTVSDEFYSCRFLFIGGTSKSKIEKRLTKLAKEAYGDDIQVVNIEYVKSWSPYSLILGLDALGYVVKFTSEAEVVRLNPVF